MLDNLWGIWLVVGSFVLVAYAKWFRTTTVQLVLPVFK